jgi:SAM-dependent methyltransferase
MHLLLEYNVEFILLLANSLNSFSDKKYTMNRFDLINYLIHQRNARRYLEIGAHDERNNFIHIQCGVKATTYPHPSDNFFIQNKEEFDIIFIDGIHTEAQVLKDINNSFRCLAKGGVIILHDCMPPDEWHQREPEEYKEGENWNGTVWKAALRVFNDTAYKCTLLDTDWGCGIIDTSVTQIPAHRKLPDVLDYPEHYGWLLAYKSGVAEYLRDNVKVFYHLACMGNWQQVFQEQMQQLQQNGFKKIQLSLLGSQEDLVISRSLLDSLKIEIETLVYDPDLQCFERPALGAIEGFVRQHNGHILYLHSKGVSNPADETKVKWRRLMMRELVENWKNCILLLHQYDVIGVNWRDMPPTSHFCGNFWFASASYLRKLADFTTYYDNPRYRIWDRINDKRLGCEFWISSGRDTPRLLSLAYRNVDFCNPGFWRNR